MWMKEMEEGGKATHSEAMSSISKRQLEGCMPGATGERSVPITSAVGNLSAMSLGKQG